jgi:hypothetical protein
LISPFALRKGEKEDHTKQFRQAISRGRNAPAVFLARPYPVWWLWKQLPERHRRIIRFWFQTEAAAASGPSDPMDSSQRRQLVEYYRSDVQQLEVMLGRAAPWEEFHGALD